MLRNLRALAPGFLGLVVGSVIAKYGFAHDINVVDRSFFQLVALVFAAWILRAKPEAY